MWKKAEKRVFKIFQLRISGRELQWITCFRKGLTIVVLAAFSTVFIAFSAGRTMAEMNASFGTDKLRLAFLSRNDSMIQWDVRAGSSSDHAPWKSLMTWDRSGRLLSRHLSLDGIVVSGGRWEISGDRQEMFFTGTADHGRLIVRKKIRLSGDDLLIVKIEMENTSGELVEIRDDVRLVLGPGIGEYPAGGFGVAETMYSYVEPALSVGGEVVGTRRDFRSLALSSAKYDWIGLHSRYFALLLSPTGQDAFGRSDIHLDYPKSSGDARIPERYLPSLSVLLHMKRLSPSQVLRREFLVFSGPKSLPALKAGGVDFSGILFSGMWFWIAFLCSAMLRVLNIIYEFAENWGLSIILLAVLVRIVMYPFTRKVLSSQKAFAEVQKTIQPEMQAIKNTCRGGEQSERILELYKRYGVSPFAGLKPLLIVLVQIPIFIALFHVLGRAFELRSASFLWMETLAEPDRLFSMGVNLPYFGEYFNVLPVFMAVTTLLTIKLSPVPAADDTSRFWQNIFLTLVAVAFFLLFYSFPSGMVLYWTTANILHLLQQFVVETVIGG